MMRTRSNLRKQRGFIINPYVYGAGGGTDPYWANVVSLLHFDGANNSTTFTDETGKTWTRNNTPIISTTQSVFGGASGLFDGGGSLDYLTTADHADWDFGSGDFTLEGRIRPVTGGYNGIITKDNNTTGYGPFVVLAYNTDLRFYASSNGTSWDIANGISIGTITTDVWSAWSVTRSGNNFYTHLDGVAGATASSSSALFSNSAAVRIAAYLESYFGTSYGGYQDEFRATKGVARYGSGNYTPAPSAFPNS